jgi:hypothetical protein
MSAGLSQNPCIEFAEIEFDNILLEFCKNFAIKIHELFL